jgi:hypothetical protein
MKKYLWLALLLFGIIKTGWSQDFQRVAPQVTNTTFVIDQNSDAKKLKENALQVLKNIGHDEYLAYVVIIEGCIETIKDQNWGEKVKNDDNSIKYTFKEKKSFKGRNEVILLINLLNELAQEDKEKKEPNSSDWKKNQIITKVSATLCGNMNHYVDRYGEKAFRKASEKLKDWSEKRSFLFVNKVNFEKRILRKITSLIETGLVVYDINSKEIKLSEVCDQLIQILPSIIGQNVEEQDRIKAISEIVFSIQNFSENIKFGITNKDSLLMRFPNSKYFVFSSDSTNYDLLKRTLKEIKAYLKNDLIDRLGARHPAVVYYEVFFSKIQVHLNKLRDEQALRPIFKLKVSDFVHDFRLLQQGKVRELKSELARKLSFSLKAGNNEGITKEFAHDYYLNTFIDIIGNEVEVTLKDVLKNSSRIAWINNFNTQQGSVELNTTVSYKIINRPTFIWEASTNFFYNTLSNIAPFKDTTTVSKIDSAKKSFAKQVFIGSNWRLVTRNNMWEFGVVASLTGQSINNLNDLRKSRTLHSYVGINVGFKLRKNSSFITRPFYEWEFQQTKDGRDLHHHNVGVEFKLPNKYLISGFFVTYKFNDYLPNAASLGIKFPIVK